MAIADSYPAPAGGCVHCGAPAYGTDEDGRPAHACCTAWETVIAAGYGCPACAAARRSGGRGVKGVTRLPAHTAAGQLFVPRMLPRGR